MNSTKSNLQKSYLWMLSFLKPHYVSIIILLTCTSITVAAEVIVPKFIQLIIDNITLNKKFNDGFVRLVIIISIIQMITIFVKVKKNFLTRTIGEKTTRDIQFTLYSHLRNLGYPYYEQKSAGETVALLNTEVQTMQQIYQNYLPGIIEHFIYAIFSIVIMIWFSPLLSVVLIPCIILYYIIGPFFERKASKYAKETALNRVELNSKIYDSVSGQLEFRVYDAHEWDKTRLMESFEIYSLKHLLWTTFATVRGSIRRVSFYIGVIVAYILGSYMIQSHQISTGSFVGFILLYTASMYKLTMLITLITEQQMLVHQYAPLYHFSELRPLVEESHNCVQLSKIKGKVSFCNVHFSYSNSSKTIRGLNLEVNPGERVAIVGTSGNGKTTLFKLLSRFYDPQQGMIKIDDFPIKDISLNCLRDAIGYVFQETYLFASTIKENIRFGNLEATDDQVIEAAKFAQANDFIMELSDGYETIIGERGYILSGGQRQRISIARMFIKQPSIVLLDEATAALDNVTELLVQQSMERLLKGRTVITIAHRLSTIKNYDRIVVIENGTIAEMGNYTELLEKRGAFYQLIKGKNYFNSDDEAG